MADQTPTDNRSSTEQILDLLLDALVERQRARDTQGHDGLTESVRPGPQPVPADDGASSKGQPSAEPVTSERPIGSRVPENRGSAPAAKSVPVVPVPAGVRQQDEHKPLVPVPPSRSARTDRRASPPKLGEEGWEPPPRAPSINLAKTVARLLVLVLGLLVLINVPVNRWGVSLARILPDSASLVIRDGLILKGSGPEIYMLQEGKLRWISSLDAFGHLGLSWEDVHVVEDEFLERFEKGRPLHVLLKCSASPHIYRLENQEKRWIQDIDTFLAEGHVWEDVRLVSCTRLRDIPDGPPIPEDAGPPPQP